MTERSLQETIQPQPTADGSRTAPATSPADRYQALRIPLPRQQAPTRRLQDSAAETLRSACALVPSRALSIHDVQLVACQARSSHTAQGPWDVEQHGSRNHQTPTPCEHHCNKACMSTTQNARPPAIRARCDARRLHLDGQQVPQGTDRRGLLAPTARAGSPHISRAILIECAQCAWRN